MTTNPSPKPNAPPAVADLYTHPQPNWDGWPDYISEYNLTAEHIPALIDIITDETHLFCFDGEFAADVVIHAYRALGQLKAAEALPAMIGLYKYEPEDILGNHFTEDLPQAIQMIGASGLPYLKDLLVSTDNGYWGQAIATDMISQIGHEHPDLRADCIEIIATQLQLYRQHDSDFNSDLILALVRMKAVEMSGLVKSVYAADRVNRFAIGDWEDLQTELTWS